MDRSIFTANAPGKFWEVSVEGYRDWAFIPDPLPEAWEIPPEIWSLLLQARIEHLFESPAITIPQFSDMCGIRYNTAQTDIERLVRANILTRSDIQARPKIYFASKILDIAYGD